MNLGEPAVPALIKALRFREIQPTVAAILGRLGPSAKAAVPALIEVLKGERIAERRAAVERELRAKAAITHPCPSP
jgi:hypothetical protein